MADAMRDLHEGNQQLTRRRLWWHSETINAVERVRDGEYNKSVNNEKILGRIQRPVLQVNGNGDLHCFSTRRCRTGGSGAVPRWALMASNGDRQSVMRKREYPSCHRAKQERNDKMVRFFPSRFRPPKVRRCHQSEYEVRAPSWDSKTLCAAKSTELEAVETDESEPAITSNKKVVIDHFGWWHTLVGRRVVWTL